MDRKEARRKAQELVMKMTIEEKASQLRYDSPGISRLGITIGGMKGYMELRERELQQFFRRQLEWLPHLMKIWFEK